MYEFLLINSFWKIDQKFEISKIKVAMRQSPCEPFILQHPLITYQNRKILKLVVNNQNVLVLSCVS